jgi:hypothetical protein
MELSLEAALQIATKKMGEQMIHISALEMENAQLRGALEAQAAAMNPPTPPAADGTEIPATGIGVPEVPTADASPETAEQEAVGDPDPGGAVSG